MSATARTPRSTPTCTAALRAAGQRTLSRPALTVPHIAHLVSQTLVCQKNRLSLSPRLRVHSILTQCRAAVTAQVDGQLTSTFSFASTTSGSGATQTSNAAVIAQNALGHGSGMGGLIGVGVALMGMVVGVAFVL